MTKKTRAGVTNEQRRQFAETLRERIYSTISLLAVIVVLWQHTETHSAWGVIWVIVGTVAALWLATIIAARMSYQIVHQQAAELHFGESKEAASGLLIPAVAPIFFILVSMTGVIELKTALLFGIISLLLSLFFFSLMSGRKLKSTAWGLIGYSLLQMGLGVMVVLIKLAVK